LEILLNKCQSNNIGYLDVAWFGCICICLISNLENTTFRAASPGAAPGAKPSAARDHMKGRPTTAATGRCSDGSAPSTKGGLGEEAVDKFSNYQKKKSVHYRAISEKHRIFGSSAVYSPVMFECVKLSRSPVVGHAAGSGSQPHRDWSSS
jgi:hypothetical protein